MFSFRCLTVIKYVTVSKFLKLCSFDFHFVWEIIYKIIYSITIVFYDVALVLKCINNIRRPNTCSVRIFLKCYSFANFQFYIKTFYKNLIRAVVFIFLVGYHCGKIYNTIFYSLNVIGKSVYCARGVFFTMLNAKVCLKCKLFLFFFYNHGKRGCFF